MLVLMRAHTVKHTDANQILLLYPIDGVGVFEVDTDDGDDDYVDYCKRPGGGSGGYRFFGMRVRSFPTAAFRCIRHYATVPGVL